MKPFNNPQLSLVGAGPGDPDLITVKGVKTLADADVVLYDALVDPVLLDHAPRAQQIFVGKRKGGIYTSQDTINTLVVDKAFNYGHVVRLKGGDPFIFGRGLEEVIYASNFGIQCRVIPGISSCYAVPESAGISLTHRGISQSFWVVTGTTAKGELSNDISLVAKSSATAVILMGMSKLRNIMEVFQKENKGDLPVAIIQNGTTPQEKIGFSIVKNSVNMAEERGLSSPAIIVIGEVVEQRIGNYAPWRNYAESLFHYEQVKVNDIK